MDSVRRRMEEVGILLLRLSFPLLAVAAGVGVEWILVLRVDPGELRFFGLACEVGWGPLGSRMDLLCCVSSGVAGRGGFLCLLVLCFEASGSGCFISMVEDGGCGDKSLRPTADALFSSISCGLPMFGVRLSICIGEMGGLKFPGAGERAQKVLHFLDRIKKINSRDFDVISGFIRIFTVRLRCTVLPVVF